MKAPAFWYRQKSVWALLLKPISFVYAWSVARRFQKTTPYQSDVPVVCVGNLTVGGSGKTPVCLTIGEFLKQRGIRFFYLNHGYKAKEKNVLVNLEKQTALDIGDEAVLLALNAPTVVDNKRARGAQKAVKNGAQAIIMDDGFQNPSLVKSFSFVVVDGQKGFGNGLVLPAGPLREPVATGLKRADAIVIAGEDTWGVDFYLKRHQIDLPVLTGRFLLNPEIVKALRGRDVFAFAGIGMPEKFFAALQNEGINVKGTQSFPDHYFYTNFDMDEVMRKAGSLPVLTTTKDAVKLSAQMRKKVIVMDGCFVFDRPAQLEQVLKGIFE